MKRTLKKSHAYRFGGAWRTRIRSTVHSPTIVLATCLLLASCGDGDPGNSHDGGLDAGDGGPADAVVDNGPLDCGVRPADGSVCVTGRLYDFQTDDPVVPGVENEIFAFINGTDMIQTRDSPDTHFGRVVPNGRYMTWTNNRYDRCLALANVVGGHMPATINCYSDSFALHPDYAGEHRYYLISNAAYSSWVDTYPGEPDLQIDRPIILGQCRTADWAPVGFGEYSFQSTFFPYAWPQSCYPLTEDRLSFVDANYLLGPLHPGGAFLYFVPLDFNGDSWDELPSLNLRCPGDLFGSFGALREDAESGDLEFAILNNVPFR